MESSIGGKYRVEHPLLFGQDRPLWLAVETVTGRRVVIKRPPRGAQGLSSAGVRLTREARTALSLKHPHVVEVLDYGEDAQGPYLVMEHLEGRDLAQLLEDRGPFSPLKTRSLLTQLEAALVLAHRRKVVHRDLKPSNLFLASARPEAVLKVLDFGIAKVFGTGQPTQPLTETGMILGSTGYMSPEQFRGHDIDHRSDLWSVAAIVYELLTGVRAFVTNHPGDLLAKVSAAHYPRASDVNPSLSRSFDAFFERAFQLSPEQRFSDVRELSAAFHRALRGARSSPRNNSSDSRTGAPERGGHRNSPTRTSKPAGPHDRVLGPGTREGRRGS